MLAKRKAKKGKNWTLEDLRNRIGEKVSVFIKSTGEKRHMELVDLQFDMAVRENNFIVLKHIPTGNIHTYFLDDLGGFSVSNDSFKITARIENVGMCDMKPRIQLEVQFGHEMKLMELVGFSSFATPYFQVLQIMSTCLNDRRHNPRLTRNEEDDEYILGCDFCKFRWRLKEVTDPIKDYSKEKLS